MVSVSYKTIIRFLRPYRLLVFAAPLLMTIEVITDLLQPKIVQYIIDIGVANSDLHVVFQAGTLMIALSLTGLIGGVGGAVFAVRAATFMGADIRSALFQKIQSLSFGNLDRLGTGKMVSLLTNDITQIQEAVFYSIHIMIRASMLLAGSVIMAFLTDSTLALIFFVLGPAIVLFLCLIIKKTITIFTAVQERLDRLNTVIIENFANMRLVKAFARSSYEKTKFSRINDDLTNHTMVAFKYGGMLRPIMMLLVNFGIICTLWFGGIKVTEGDMLVGQLIAFVNYLTQALMSTLMVGMLFMRISRAAASAKRINTVMESRPEIQQFGAAQGHRDLNGRLCFENVTFSYNSGKTFRPPVLKNISFTVDQGETVAVLGATGSGKTSLVQLIPRFYEVSKGRITINDTDIRDFPLEDLRKNIGIAMQDALLFSLSIRDNIRYGKPEAADEEVVRAARMAQAHDFIAALPEGYDTIIGQRGVDLSGGQKQRISIARALLINPSILILDDSTSAVDVETEGKIQEAISQAGFTSTRFIITQRISSIIDADRIIVLDNGMIAADGSHDSLLNTSPIYQEIYDSQLGRG